MQLLLTTLLTYTNSDMIALQNNEKATGSFYQGPMYPPIHHLSIMSLFMHAQAIPVCPSETTELCLTHWAGKAVSVPGPEIVRIKWIAHKL